MRIFSASLLLVASICSSGVVKADTFNLTAPGTTIFFTLPSSPVVSGFQTDTGFNVQNVLVTVNGSSFVMDVGFGFGGLTEYPDIMFAGEIGYPLPNSFTAGGPVYGLFQGLQLYSGDESAPTFLTGNYDVKSFIPATFPTGPYNLEITDSSAATPEPSSFVLFGTGLLGAVGVMRRKLLSR
jgi:hypothetical protein